MLLFCRKANYVHNVMARALHEPLISNVGDVMRHISQHNYSKNNKNTKTERIITHTKYFVDLLSEPVRYHTLLLPLPQSIVKCTMIMTKRCQLNSILLKIYMCKNVWRIIFNRTGDPAAPCPGSRLLACSSLRMRDRLTQVQHMVLLDELHHA